MEESLLNFSIVDRVTASAVEYLPKVVLAVVVLIVGFWVVNKVIGLITKAMNSSNLEPSLQRFLGSIIAVFLKILLVLSVAGMVGIDTTSFIAIFGALMVGIGMALNGTIGHFASGVLLMIFKPFKVGDLVTIGGGETGTVEAINAFNTTLETLDNKRIIISNSNVTGNTITNISGQEIIGVELTFGIGYNDDIDKARQIILQVGKECTWVLEDPAQGAVVAELADSSVNLATRPFCKSEHYWDTLFYMQEHVKKQFDANNIGIPFPQMDVHMINNN